MKKALFRQSSSPNSFLAAYTSAFKPIDDVSYKNNTDLVSNLHNQMYSLQSDNENIIDAQDRTLNCIYLHIACGLLSGFFYEVAIDFVNGAC